MFRFRGKLAPLGNSVILKVSADSELEAMAEASRVLKTEGYDLSKISGVSARDLGTQRKSSSVYVGAVPAKRAKRGTATAPVPGAAIDGPSPAAVAAQPEAAPAPAPTPAPEPEPEPEKGKGGRRR